MDAIERSLKILGLGPDATAQDVKKSYRDLVKVWHPDRFLNNSRVRRRAEEKLKEINGAYKILQGYDPGSRARSRPHHGPSARPNPAQNYRRADAGEDRPWRYGFPHQEQNYRRADAPKHGSSSPPYEPADKSDPGSPPAGTRKRASLVVGIVLVMLVLAKGLLRESPTTLMRLTDEMAGSTATAVRVLSRLPKTVNQEPSSESVNREAVPYDAQAYTNRGNQKYALGHYAAASADYDTAIRIKPDYALAYYNRGAARYRLGLIRKARQDFQTALKLAREAGDENLKASIEEIIRDFY